MYFLTLFGAQMLFFSLAHIGTPVVILPLLASVGCFLALAVLNMLRLAVKTLDGGAYVLAFQVVHVLLLFTYDAWASITALRIPIALGGIAFGLFVLWKVFADKPSNLSPQPDAPTSGAPLS